MTDFARSTMCAGALAAFLAGCLTVGPDYLAPELETPDTWYHVAVAGVDSNEASLHRWWDIFDDPVLTSLIDRAAENNLNLELAAERVLEARALYRIATGERVPDLDASGVFQVDRVSESVAPSLGARDRTDTFYGFGADAIWELDFWGRIKRSIEAADATVGAAEEDYRDVLVLLNAAAAQSYIDACTALERIRLAEKNVRLQTSTLDLTRNRFDAGLVPLLDVRQAELNLSRTESTIPPLRVAHSLSLNRLGVLLGGFPTSLYEELSTTGTIPDAGIPATFGVPADLLRQRPDVRAAERRLAAQTARIGVATADLYPTFTLFGNIGMEAIDIGDLFEGSSFVWAAGPQFRWNLFDGGRVRGRIDVEQARAEQFVTAYRQTLLVALEEVENGLVAYQREREREQMLLRTVVAAQQSAELVETLYRTGLTDFQNVLDTQRALFQEEDQLATSRGSIAKNLVSVYAALGGGWTMESVAPATDTDPEASPDEES